MIPPQSANDFFFFFLVSRRVKKELKLMYFNGVHENVQHLEYSFSHGSNPNTEMTC